jgi:hypothetical protein
MDNTTDPPLPNKPVPPSAAPPPPPPPPASDAPREPSLLRSFRLKLDPETDIVALTALFLSIGGLIYQGFLAVKTPDILQFPPEQILFYPEQNNNVDYVQIGAQSTYVNKGKGERNAVLKTERILFDLAGKSYELKWQSFVNYSNKGMELKIDDSKPALPAVMKSGDGASHETHFAPRSFHVGAPTDAGRYKNFLPWATFVSEIEKVKELDLRIVGEFYGLKDKETRVYVEVTPGMIHSLKTNRWAAPSAWPRESKASPIPAISASSPERSSSSPIPTASASPSP